MICEEIFWSAVIVWLGWQIAPALWLLIFAVWDFLCFCAETIYRKIGT